MTRIYIRHAPKTYKNGQSHDFKHDPGITENSITSIQQCCTQLIKVYGFPSAIICSPYRRTRETAIQMKNYLDTSYNSILPVPIYCDVSLSEYLGNHASEKIDVTQETISYKPPHPEKWKQFTSRISNHNNNIKYLDKVSDCVWFITHGLIISLVARSHNTIVKDISPLGSIAIQSGDKAVYLPFNQTTTTQ